MRKKLHLKVHPYFFLHVAIIGPKKREKNNKHEKNEKVEKSF